MANQRVEDLLRQETLLNRSFALWMTMYIAVGVLGVFVGARGGIPLTVGVALVQLALLLTYLASYIWFIIEVTRTAKALEKRPLPFLAWMLVAPVIGLIIGLIPVFSIFAIVIGASPLSIKFLLAGQLRTEIHNRTFATT